MRRWKIRLNAAAFFGHADGGEQLMNTENHKGELQEYCMARELGIPQYVSNLVGPPNDPSWIVTVKWGRNEEHTTEPVVGTKKYAEQVAAQQALARIASEAAARKSQGQTLANSRQGSTLADAWRETKLSTVASHPETDSEARDQTPITAHVALVGHAVGIANYRYNEKRREARTHSQQPISPDTDEAFAQEVGELTMKIVRALSAAAKRHNITIETSSQIQEKV